jgi:putative ABC transport system permease protein
MSTLGQDLRYGLRMLRKTPGFTTAAIVTLALAIGASTAIFSVVYPVLLRPLPFTQPDRLVTVGEARHKTGCCSYNASYPDYQDWIRTSKSFSSLAGYAPDVFALSGNGEPKTIFCNMVTVNFFSTLGVDPILGRSFAPGEDLPEGSGPNVALLSYQFWKNDFGGDPRVVGRVVRMDNKPVTIIGVLPNDFDFPPAGFTPLWVPLHLNPYEATARNARWLSVVGRLAPGQTLQQAQAEMQTITAQLVRQFPQQNAKLSVSVAPLREQIVGNVRPLLWILFGAVVFVLIIACANVANLLMSRSIDRRREFAIRTALGASQLHIVAQLLIESLILAVSGALVGFSAAWLGVWTLVRSIPEAQFVVMPYLRHAGISFPVLGFVVAITMLAAIFFGLEPALSIPKTPITDVLKDESRGGTSSSHGGMRNTLVIAEIAISLLLLVAGGLMLQSVRALLHQNPGFDADHLLTFVVYLPGSDYPVDPKWPFSNAHGLRFAHEFLERLRNLPYVKGASATSALPAISNHSTSRFVIAGRATAPGEDEAASTRRVDAEYFSVIKTPLLHGRFFNRSDGPGRPGVVIVNEAWVQHFLSPGEDPIGKQIKLSTAPEETFRQIVGVVGDVAEDNLAVPPPPVMYFPMDQDSGYTGFLIYVLRTQGEPGAVLGSVRAVLGSVDPQLAIMQPEPMQEYVDRSPAVFLRRYPFYLIGSFAGLAVILAMVGLYGLISYSVVQRTREIGIRMALGAQPRTILKLVIRQGVLTAILGVAVGAAASLSFGFLLTRAMPNFLYGVSSTDWPTFTIVSLLLLAVALTASYIPARRATAVDPMIALRNE